MHSAKGLPFLTNTSPVRQTYPVPKNVSRPRAPGLLPRGLTAPMSYQLQPVMSYFQQMFDDRLEKELSADKIILGIILKKCKKAGVRLTKRMMGDLREQVKASIEKPGSTITIDDVQLRRSNPQLPEDFDLNIEIASRDYEVYARELNRRLEKAIPGMVERVASSLYKSIRQERHITLAGRDYVRAGFEERLLKFWRVPIATLDLFITTAQQVGSDINTSERPRAAREKDIVFDALTRLHARACLIAQEALSLIKTGFADGANARWRTLHELVVVATFIGEHGNEVAKRYLLHQHVDSYRGAIQFNNHNRKLGYRKIPSREIARMKAVVDKLIGQFGVDFKNEYGWASVALGKKNPRFVEIESSLKMDHLRPYYKMASHSVHAGPKGVFFSLGLMDNTEILLAGPSNNGFTDPAQNVALSLLQITLSLLVLNPNIDSLAWMQTLTRLSADVGPAFFKKQQSLDERGAKVSKKARPNLPNKK